MNVLLLQIIAAFFALFALSRAYLRFKERKLSSFAFIFWTIVWLVGTTAIFFPDLTTQTAKWVGIGRGVDAIIYASIIVIFYMVFRLYIKIEDTQKQITSLTRIIALKKPSKDNPK